MRFPTRLPLFTLAIVIMVALNAVPAMALDCTPLDSFLCSGNAYQEYLGTGAVPGELACGTDYTGWDFQVFNVVLTAPSTVYIESHTSGWDPAVPDNHLLLFESCDLSQCIASDTSVDTTHTIVACLDTGTYTLIVASITTAPTVFIVGTAGCLDCDPVAGESRAWGAVKSLYR